MFLKFIFIEIPLKFVNQMSEVPNWTFQIPTKIIFGDGCLDQIGRVAKEFRAKKALIISGRKAMRQHGIIAQVIDSLQPVISETFEECEPNPSMKTMERARNIVKEKNCDLIVGLGGGSSIDVAKVIAAVGKGDESIPELFSPPAKIDSKDFPLIAIPTTSGSGSEGTPFSVATDPKDDLKKVTGHLFFYPSVSLVDPILCKTMPKDVTAQTGLDAISHAIEAYWAKLAQPITDSLSLDSLRRILPNIRKAYNEPTDSKTRSEMALGSLMAGIALGNTKATAPHSISFPLTSKYDIPHGLACALTLPLFLRFNAESISNKLPRLFNVMGVKSVEEASKSLTNLMSDLGQPIKLSELGVGKDDIVSIVEQGFSPARVANNPRKIEAKDVEEILNEIIE